jgi:methionine biosynthesis protein MetW
MGDNRNYHFEPGSLARREEFQTIVDWVPDNSSVLDLGCGDGSLLKLLIEKRNARVEGMEITSSGVEVCRAKGLNVRQGSIDETLPWPDRSFDYAVCNVTLQMVMYPEKLLSEMARVASRQIVAFPNFANLRNRLELLLMGRMPQAMLFGYAWWDTGHIHQLSVRDFEEYLPRVGLHIRRRSFFGRLAKAARFAPNLFASLAAFELESVRRSSI